MGAEPFAELMQRAPDSVPLDQACLLIAKQANPALDVDDYLLRLDEIAESCPAPLLETMVEHLFRDVGFAGNSEHYYDRRNVLLDHVIDRRLGMPITLAVVAMEVGRRIGVPLSGIGMPGHFLLRDKVDAGVYLDPFTGAFLDRRGCIELYQGVGGGSWTDDYLEPVTRRSIIVRVLSNLKEIAKGENDLTMVRWVMRLRSTVPGLGEAERAEFAALMAPLN